MYSANLAWGEMAVAYVDSMMKWPTTNREDDVEHRLMYSMKPASTEPVRSEYKRRIASGEIISGKDLTQKVDLYVDLANIAIKHGVGNCTELAAIAFKWLVEVQKVPCSVTFYALYHASSSFHEFLILGGRQPTSWQIQYVMKYGQIPSDWPPNAVWCDPWRREWFEIKDDWQRRIRMIVEDCGLWYQSEIPTTYGLLARAHRPVLSQIV